MSILGCALMGDWQAISFDKCTYFSPYHNPALHMNQTVHADKQLKIQKLSDNVRDHSIFTSSFGERISCSVISEQTSCERKYNECRLIQYSPGIKFDIYNYPCETISNDKRVKTYACQWNRNQTFCLHVNETNDQATTQSFAANAHILLSQHKYKDIIKRCTQADVNGTHCHWIPNSPITKHYCTDCPPICRGVSRSLNFAQFCIGAAVLMLSIPVAWVPVAAMASERTTKEMQVPK